RYDLEVPEDTPVESRLQKVLAIDPDAGLNGEIYYSLAEETQYFAIHPTLGIIYNTRPLALNQLLATGQTDSREDFVVHLTVLAKDRGLHQFASQTIESSKAQVNIRITPVNRHRPQIVVKQHSTLSGAADR